MMKIWLYWRYAERPTATRYVIGGDCNDHWKLVIVCNMLYNKCRAICCVGVRPGDTTIQVDTWLVKQLLFKFVKLSVGQLQVGQLLFPCELNVQHRLQLAHWDYAHWEGSCITVIQLPRQQVTCWRAMDSGGPECPDVQVESAEGAPVCWRRKHTPKHRTERPVCLAAPEICLKVCPKACKRGSSTSRQATTGKPG